MPLILVRRGRFVRGDRLEDLIIQHLQNIFNHFFTSSKNATIYPKPQKSENLVEA